MELLKALKPRFKKPAMPGLTLVEILIAMALMGFVMLSISNFVVKSNVHSSSLSMRFKEASEIHAVIQDIQADLHRGAYISPNSFNRRLEYTTYDPGSGNAVKKVYGICYYSAVQTDSTLTNCPLFGGGNTVPYLKLSTDGGATWGSPYRISGFNKYRMSGTPKFLYGNSSNTCFDYADDNNNGVLGSGDSTQTFVSCSASSATAGFTAASSRTPTKASKVVLSGFSFTTGTGSPEALRSLPPYIFISVAPGPVRDHATAAVSPGVRDSVLLQSFSVDSTVNPSFPSGFSLSGLTWDPTHERLIIGTNLGGKVYQTERNGVIINTPLALPDFNISARHITIEGDGQTLVVLSYNLISNRDEYYRYNLNSSTPLTSMNTLIPMDVAEGYRVGVAYDSNTPDYIYVVCNSGGYIIQRYNKYTGVKTGTTLNTDRWALPAAYTSPGDLGGLVIDPTTGNFYTVRNMVYTSGGRRYIDVYKITRAGVATLDFSIDLTDFNSTTGQAAEWGLAYDPVLNRLFLSDKFAKRIYEIAPPKLISPRS